METQAVSELFPLFNTANIETLEWLLSVAEEEEYEQDSVLVTEDTWGKAVYFIVSGWVKVRRLSGDETFTLAILGRGDFFGEMAILDESPRSTDVSALSPVKLLSIPAQKFVQTLFKDPQLHHRMLQLMVRRLRQTNIRFQLRNQPPAVKLANILVNLAEAYGQQGSTIEIFNVPLSDLANVADIGLNEATKIIDLMNSKGWIKVNEASQTMSLVNFKQLQQLAHKV